MVDAQILPILKSLSIEVKKKAQDVDREWIQMDKDMARDRDLYVKLVANLRTSLIRHQWKGDVSSSTAADKDIPRDPWLVDRRMTPLRKDCMTQ
jgi:hypothetical protein